MNYKEFYSELINAIPKLSPFLAKRLIDRAFRDICDSRQWSFLKAEGILYSPAVITTGSFNVTQFSNIIVASASAITALNNLNNPLLTKRQIRFGSGGTPIYNISIVSPTFSSDGIIYLDRPYKEASNTANTYRVYRCYYGPPETTTLTQALDGTVTTVTGEDTNFLRFNDIYNPLNSRWFILPPLARELLDRKDPQRSVTGNIPYWLFAYKSINNLPYYEMWPHPLTAAAYPCSYQKRTVDFSLDSDTLPYVIPDELLLERALFYGCSWADKNSTRYSELKGVNWKLNMAAHKQTYSNISSRDPGLLEIAQRNDEELYPQSLIIDTRSYSTYPIGDDDRMVYSNITP